jgi:hypothetical protein
VPKSRIVPIFKQSNSFVSYLKGLDTHFDAQMTWVPMQRLPYEPKVPAKPANDASVATPA